MIFAKEKITVNTTTIEIKTEFIRLDQLLKFSGLVNTGGMAKEIIQQGYVFVNGECCTLRGKKIRPGDKITVENETVLVTGQ